MNKYGNSFNIGNPDLPVLNRLIEVPAGATVSVNVTSYDEVLLNLANYDINKLIAPAQESVSKSADPDKIPFEKMNMSIQQTLYFQILWLDTMKWA